MLRRALRGTGYLAAAGVAGTYGMYRYERSQIPAGTELIKAAAAPPTTTLKKLSTDNLMGGFDAYSLGGTWFYDKPIDAAKI